MWNDLTERHPSLDGCRDDIARALEIIMECYERGGKLLLCGNGGSAADCEHIVGELLKDFLIKRPLPAKMRADMRKRYPDISDETLDMLQLGLPAVSLPSIVGFNTAFCNDRNAELVYAQGVMSLGKAGDVLVAISTSGNAENVLRAAKVAKGVGMTVIALTGKDGGKLRKFEVFRRFIFIPTYRFLNVRSRRGRKDRKHLPAHKRFWKEDSYPQIRPLPGQIQKSQ